MTDAEQRLRARLTSDIEAIYREAKRQAEPLIAQLVALEALSPPKPFVMPADFFTNPEKYKHLDWFHGKALGDDI